MKNKQSIVSMVMPCYNKVKYISGMLDSVIAQKWDNIELILVNDGSNDGTREVIAKYESKLAKRGYKVVIIDQGNQGTAAAVRNGMLQMSGEYFCTVDCDDELMPEYVSEMAGWLDNHPDYEWAACDIANRKEWEDTPIPRSISFVEAPDCLERYLYKSKDTCVTACIYMVRISYIRACRLIELFIVKPGLHQESQIVIPLLAGKGKIKKIQKALYIYNNYSSYHSKENHLFDANTFYDNRFNLIKEIIKSLYKERNNRVKYISLVYLHKIKCLLYYIGYINNTNDEISVINSMFFPNPEITKEKIDMFSYDSLFIAIENRLFHRSKPMNLLQSHKGRIIGCGVLGNNGRRYVKMLRDTGLRFDEMWDEAADMKSKLGGLPVTKPNYYSLLNSDAVLVFPSAEPGITDIVSSLCERGIYNYLTLEQIKSYLAYRCYPQICDTCELIGAPSLLE